MGCGCGSNKPITRNKATALPKNTVQSLSTNVNNTQKVNSLSTNDSLSSDDRAKEKKRREIMLKRLGRL